MTIATEQMSGDALPQIILHHYDFSNYSEKVRVALGYKSIAWRSVIVPPVLPKSDLVTLTGGYRRAPVMQIGADIYCDTRLILRELDRRHPTPALYVNSCTGAANAISSWAETTFLHSVMLLAWGTNHDLMPPELFEDRAAMRGLPVPSRNAVDQTARRNAPLVRAQLPYLENMLADGRRWICGETFSAADLAVFHTIWFLTDRSDRLADILDGHNKLATWMQRVRKLGHGTSSMFDASSAFAVAASHCPNPPRASRLQREDPPIGSIVSIRPNDYAKDAVIGRLDLLDDDEVSLRLLNHALGEIAVHFPRIGFDMRPVIANKDLSWRAAN